LIPISKIIFTVGDKLDIARELRNIGIVHSFARSATLNYQAQASRTAKGSPNPFCAFCASLWHTGYNLPNVNHDQTSIADHR
jgi:hypothetical protein